MEADTINNDKITSILYNSNNSNNNNNNSKNNSTLNLIEKNFENNSLALNNLKCFIKIISIMLLIKKKNYSKKKYGY